ELDLLVPGRLHVHMVVGVIANWVAGLNDFFQPVDVFLLQHPTDREAVDHSSLGLHPPAGLDGVFLGLGVQVPLLVVPMGLLPTREVAAHLQVERDGDEGLALSGSGTRKRLGERRHIAKKAARARSQESSTAEGHGSLPGQKRSKLNWAPFDTSLIDQRLARSATLTSRTGLSITAIHATACVNCPFASGGPALRLISLQRRG